ncbi:MAG: 50S ribosomal protein L13 [Polyangiaceae bacterium]|nr:50S ribosomal protein L13 [Myxococcales bacterium]MCB9587056.1 50S ribosomal protein L13 [Polyangiaceae bacterium]MCB9610130.1 50S ribosomal protein L13 [Polyangiaceae bacterium]
MRTFVAKPAEAQATRKWWVVDAKNKSLGRLASEVAKVLRGKHKATFTPHVDTGDFVIVINAEQVKVTGSKFDDKKYYRHSGYPGGMTTRSFGELIALKPAAPIELAVKGMLPKNALGRKMIKKLKVYAGAEHPHAAQAPAELSF